MNASKLKIKTKNQKNITEKTYLLGKTNVSQKANR